MAVRGCATAVDSELVRALWADDRTWEAEAVGAGDGGGDVGAAAVTCDARGDRGGGFFSAVNPDGKPSMGAAEILATRVWGGGRAWDSDMYEGLP